MDDDHRNEVGDALALTIDGLAPFVERVFQPLLPAGTTWPDVLRIKDGRDGRDLRRYSPGDLALLLRALTERLGDLGYPFDQQLSRQGQNYARELRDIRNRWAHNEPFTTEAAYRALDSAELLLRTIDATDQADQIATAKQRLIPLVVSDSQVATTASAGTDEPLTTPTDPSESGAPSLKISAIEVLSYAMANCRIAVVDEIAIANPGAEARGATLDVTVVGPTGSLGDPKVHVVDLGEDSTTTLRSVGLVLDPAQMLRVDEQTVGQIRAVLKAADGDLLAEASVDVRILAAGQWLSDPPALALEMLAAHVQPNAQALQPLLLAVSDELRTRTGRSGIDGYQSDDPARVDAIVAATYDAIRARDLRYAEPPASWGIRGQKIRTAAEVLDGRLGTCLDTTVTMAAALEQAGLNTLLWLLGGHSFLGYWRVDVSLPVVASTEVVDLVNLVELGQIGLVETTLLTGGPDSADFETATNAPRLKYLQADLGAFVGVTDVKAARESGILPLPSRSVDADGQVVVSVYEPPARGDAIPDTGGSSTSTTAAASPAAAQVAIPPRVARWKNSLLDLSLRNRLINYTDRAGYRLDVPPPALGRFEDMVNTGAVVGLRPSDSIPEVDQARGLRFGRDLPEDVLTGMLTDRRQVYIDLTAGAYRSKLRYLAYKAKTITDETGSNNLYLAFGTLSWTFNERDLKSPLVLVPVTMTTASRGESYRLSVDEAGSSTPNYCLLEKLKVSFGLDIPGLANPAEDAAGIDLQAAFQAVRAAIAVAGLPFRVEETVHLAILQFAKFPLWKDLDEHWPTLAKNTLVDHLIHSPLEPFRDPVEPPSGVDLDSLGAAVPVAADSSQLDAVADAVGGRTFVLEGPPGTGKSQTITNLLARSLTEGKRVLFVAEKRAALDVVKDRLEAVGLGPLALDLHDKSAKPAMVRAQIKAALDLQARTDRDGLKVNGATAQASREALTRYAARLHERNAAGLSLYSAWCRELAADPDVAAMPVPASFVEAAGAAMIDGVRTALQGLPSVADLAHPQPRHPWGFADQPTDDADRVAAILTSAQGLDAALEAVLGEGLSWDDVGRLASPATARLWAQVGNAPRYPLATLDALFEEPWRQRLAELDQRLRTCRGIQPSWLAQFRPDVVDLDLAGIHQAAVAANASSFFGRKKRRREVIARLSSALIVDSASIPLKELSALTAELAENGALVADLRARAADLPGSPLPAQWNPMVAEQAADVAQRIDWLTWIGERVAWHGPEDADRNALREFYAATPQGRYANALDAIAAHWEQLLAAIGGPSEAAQEWQQPETFLRQWWLTREARRVRTSSTLECWLALLAQAEPLRVAGLDAARREILWGRVRAEDAVIAFERGLAVSSIGERQETTALDDFDLDAHTKTIGRYTSATDAIRNELPRAIPADVLALRRFSAEAAAGQVGGLRRQLERQRGGMRVRRLLDEYGELITQIMPCTLMSPESVARFFPAREGLFDIVVFDEASQIRVADAVGAMGRGASVVVVGDSKQMPPTSFAEATTTVEDEAETSAEVVQDEESILTECVQAQVPRRWLSWHYRSQDESLIAFSNYQYYENRLSSFPSPLRTGIAPLDAGHGISLVRVNGTFERTGRGKDLRTNRVEAEAIVDDVQRRFWRSPDRAPSVGVITFNAQQRDLIDNLLRDCGDDRVAHALDEPDGLFVKNLENVQGDERDTILFSVAFSANERGVVPLNFGPLSRPGGERRLNVAITRARREVVLYASFAPSELRAEETMQIGTKHLKAYLEMAERGVQSIAVDGGRTATIDRHRDEIASALKEAGVAVRTDVGLSDFRVDLVLADRSEPDRPLVAVLLDGEAWRARRTVGDRDGLPTSVLSELMRWPGVERVWLPDWLDERDRVVERLVRATADAGRRADEPAEVTPGQERLVEPAEPSEPSGVGGLLRGAPTATAPAPEPTAKHPMLRDFRPWVPGQLGRVSMLDVLPSPRPVRHLLAAIDACVVAEGPVHQDRLVRLVGGAFGLSRVPAARAAVIRGYVASSYLRDDDPGFCWPAGVDPASWRVVRCPAPGESRPLDQVSVVELANAMAVAAETAGGMTEDEVKREALALFGGRRITEAIGARLDEGLRYASAHGRLRQVGGGIYVAVS